MTDALGLIRVSQHARQHVKWLSEQGIRFALISGSSCQCFRCLAALTLSLLDTPHSGAEKTLFTLRGVEKMGAAQVVCN